VGSVEKRERKNSEKVTIIWPARWREPSEWKKTFRRRCDSERLLPSVEDEIGKGALRSRPQQDPVRGVRGDLARRPRPSEGIHAVRYASIVRVHLVER
jgi:hypothetical protein